MDEPGPFLRLDEGCRVDAPGILAAPRQWEVLEGTPILQADELVPADPLEHGCVRVLRQRALSNDNVPTWPVSECGGGDADVGECGVDGDRDVGDESPRGRGPDDEVGSGQWPVFGQDREAYLHCRLFDVLVDLRLAQLMGRQRGTAATAVGNDAVPLVHQALRSQVAQQPPHGLDVLVGHGPVRRIHVDPDSRALREGFPVIDITLNGESTMFVELLDTECFNLAFGSEAEFFFDLDLDGQTVAVPTSFAWHLVSLHGAESHVEILEAAGPHMVNAGTAVSGRRALVKTPSWRRGSLRFHGTRKVNLVPPREHPLLKLAQGERTHRSGCHCDRLPAHSGPPGVASRLSPLTRLDHTPAPIPTPLTVDSDWAFVQNRYPGYVRVVPGSRYISVCDTALRTGAPRRQGLGGKRVMGRPPRELTPLESALHFFGAELRHWRTMRELSQAGSASGPMTAAPGIRQSR